MARALLLALTLVGCTPPPPASLEIEINFSFLDAGTPKPLYRNNLSGCETPCGLLAPASINCEELAKIEREALLAYATHAKLKVTDMCPVLRNWIVVTSPTADSSGAWRSKTNGNVLGLCSCDERKLIIVGTDKWYQSALVHEMGHVFDYFVVGDKNPKHPGWKKRGYCKAINAVSELKDDCDKYGN